MWPIPYGHLLSNKERKRILYWLLKITDVDEDLFQHLLFLIPKFYAEKSRPPFGYELKVKEDFMRFIDHMADVSSAVSYCLKHMVRVYAADNKDELMVLLVGSDAENIGAWIEKDELMQNASVTIGSFSTVPEADWTIMGIAFPGWLVVFDDTAEVACRDDTDKDFDIVYIPQIEKFEELFEDMTPDKNAEEAASILLDMTFHSLPLRL